MRIYLDLCAIQRPFDDPSQPRVRAEAEAVLSVLDLARRDLLQIVTSGAHVVENARCPFPDRRAYVGDVIALSDAVSTPPSARRRAQEYVANGIKPLDAIHLASAVEADADFFCTTDDRFLRRGLEADTGQTAVVSPLDLVLYLSLP